MGFCTKSQTLVIPGSNFVHVYRVWGDKLEQKCKILSECRLISADVDIDGVIAMCATTDSTISDSSISSRTIWRPSVVWMYDHKGVPMSRFDVGFPVTHVRFCGSMLCVLTADQLHFFTLGAKATCVHKRPLPVESPSVVAFKSRILETNSGMKERVVVSFAKERQVTWMEWEFEHPRVRFVRSTSRDDLHQHSITNMAIDLELNLLLTASTQGTVIRAFSLDSAESKYEFRRGYWSAGILDMGFGWRRAGEEPFVYCLSENMTLHFWETHPLVPSILQSVSGVVESLMSLAEGSPMMPVANVPPRFGYYAKTTLPLPIKKLEISCLDQRFLIMAHSTTNVHLFIYDTVAETIEYNSCFSIVNDRT
jgi:hypothetical protein